MDINIIRKEDTFKSLLEILFLQYQHYNNLITFIDNNYETNDPLTMAKDFAEELSLYETDIEEIFSTNIFDINSETLDINFNTDLLNNISKALIEIKALIPHDFEKLCALYIKFLGTTGIPNITKHSHDQGIDFVGIVERKVHSRLFSSKSNINKIYLIGQAKHYDTDKVKSNEIRELAGSIYLLKTKGFALKDDPYPNISIKSFTPIYVYFITSYYFSEAAKRLCIHSDIMPIDRILLALTFGLNSEYHDVTGHFCPYTLKNALSNINYF
ncbi:restriction endonuclease [Bacillus velezensis]